MNEKYFHLQSVVDFQVRAVEYVQDRDHRITRNHLNIKLSIRRAPHNLNDSKWNRNDLHLTCNFLVIPWVCSWLSWWICRVCTWQAWWCFRRGKTSHPTQTWWTGKWTVRRRSNRAPSDANLDSKPIVGNMRKISSQKHIKFNTILNSFRVTWAVTTKSLGSSLLTVPAKAADRATIPRRLKTALLQS